MIVVTIRDIIWKGGKVKWMGQCWTIIIFKILKSRLVSSFNIPISLGIVPLRSIWSACYLNKVAILYEWEEKSNELNKDEQQLFCKKLRK